MTSDEVALARSGAPTGSAVDGSLDPDPAATGALTPPTIVRCAYVDLVVSDLAASRAFYVDVLGLVVTEESATTLSLRTYEEFIHHNVVLRQGPIPAAAAIGFRVATARDVDRAQAWFTALGCPVARRPEGFAAGVGDTVRVVDPFGFPMDFFFQIEHVPALTWRHDLHPSNVLARFDHVNQVVPDVLGAQEHLVALGFKVSEDIRGSDGTLYASWVRRTQTVHDTALTGGRGPCLHHVAFATYERGNVLALCDKLGGMARSDIIERGPGRHGVSNAFYVYLRDPDGHRVEVYTSDYYTGDPDHPVRTWDVTDIQRRDWWGNPIVHSWYHEASLVLDLDGNPQPVSDLIQRSEDEVTVGADGFTTGGPRT